MTALTPGIEMMRKTTRLAPALAAAVAATLFGCGGEDPDTPAGETVICGDGTTLVDGVCVADESPTACDGEYTEWVDGACVPVQEVCGTGTIYVDGICVPDGDFEGCPVGEVLLGGACVPVDCPEGEAFLDGVCIPLTGATCGDGTVLVDEACQPAEDLCPAGQIYIAGTCRDERGCGTGTIEEDGQCVAIDPIGDVDADELEPNDPDLDGTPQRITLPMAGDSYLVRGTIAPPWVVGEPAEDEEPEYAADIDLYEFDGAAGQRIQLEVTAMGVPSTAASVWFVPDATHPDVEYTRHALPLNERNGARILSLPVDGTYQIMVGDGSNLLTRLGFEDGIFGGWHGAEDYTYVLNLTTLPSGAPETIAATEFEITGDLLDVPEILISQPEGTLVSLELVPDAAADLDAMYWGTQVDHYGYLGTFGEGNHSTPAGGLLITADYAWTETQHTGFTLVGRPVGVTEVGVIDPAAVIGYADVNIGAGRQRYYRINVVDPIVLAASVDTPGASRADILLEIQDDELATVGVANRTGDERSIRMALDPGIYHVVPREMSHPDTEGNFTFNLSMRAYPLLPLGDGVLAAHEDMVSATTTALYSGGREVFYSVEMEAVGDYLMRATPGAQLNADLQLFDSTLLAQGGAYNPTFSATNPDAGMLEEVSLFGGTMRLIARVWNPGGDIMEGGDLELMASVTIPEDLATEIEPNNTSASATDLGTIPPEGLRAWGLLGAGPPVDDVFRFTLENPADVRFWTSRLGATDTDTVLTVYDATGEEMGTHDDITSVNRFSSLPLTLEDGTYTVVVSTPDGRPSGGYLLTATITQEYTACAPTTDTCVGSEINRCNGAGDVLTVIPCTAGCTVGNGASCVWTDELEPNNSALEAVDLGTLTDGRTTVEGAFDDLGEGRDVDWYQFTMSAGSNATIGTMISAVEPQALDTELSIFAIEDPETPLAANNDDGDGNFSLIPPTYYAAGTYLLRVESDTGLAPVPGHYRVFIDAQHTICTPSANTCDGNDVVQCNVYGTEYASTVAHCAGVCELYETIGGCNYVAESEPDTALRNDSGDRAQVLDIGVGRNVVEGGIDNGVGTPDADWYQFTLVDRTDVSVRVGPSLLSPETAVNTATSLYAATDTSTPIETHDGTTTDVIGPRNLEPGDYLIRVAHFEWSVGVTGEYRMALDVDDPLCVSDQGVCVSESELEWCERGTPTTFTCATTCGPDGASESCDIRGSEAWDGEISVVDEIDSFAFTVDAGTILTFESRPSGGNSWLVLCHYDDAECSRSNSVASADQGGYDAVDQLRYTFVDSGAYKIRVGFWSGGTGTYRLTAAPFIP